MPSTFSVITTFPQSKWDEYAKRMVETYIANWPQSIKLKIYYENQIPEDVPQSDQIEWIDLFDACPDLVAFKEKHKNNIDKNKNNIKD